METKKQITAFDIPELKQFVESILSAYLKGKLPPKEVAEKLATQLELEAVREVLDRFVQEGRIAQEEAEAIVSELQSKRSLENGIAAAAGVSVGSGAALTMVSASGTVAGLSGAGITSGLAALGGLVGGGMAAGLLVTAGGAFVVGAAMFWVTKKTVRVAQKALAGDKAPEISGNPDAK